MQSHFTPKTLKTNEGDPFKMTDKCVVKDSPPVAIRCAAGLTGSA